MKIAVVGSGVAGLSVAALLGKEGFEVEVYESSPQVGGKMYQYTNEDSLSWDTGPTLISLPNEIYHLFEKLFHILQEILNEHRMVMLDEDIEQDVLIELYVFV